jgi:AcrR family transcriptional regulator
MKSLSIRYVGRIAGFTAAETRERLLRAAADVFARRGYDGTRVADIAATAGVSNGALYAHFGSKAELLVAALRTNGHQMLAELFATDPDRPITELLLEVGRSLSRPRDASGYLAVEALVAARRDDDVAPPMREWIGERADWLAELVRIGQTGGELDGAVSPRALAHFCLLLGMGGAVINSELNPVDEDEWADLLARVVRGLAPPATTTKAKTGEQP